ncbi:MAG: acyltransferase family protein [Aristaeellaceae bacterium]
MHRYKEIDVLKGLGIVLMIMGHQGYGAGFDKWIHAFHMPMFFIISGFLYQRPHTIRKGVRNRARSLLIPYAFFACVHLGIMSVRILASGESAGAILSYVYHILMENTEGMPVCGAIWFLTALFFTTAIFILIDGRIHRRVPRALCILAVTILGCILPGRGYRLPLALDVSLVGTGLFFVGSVLRGIYEKKRLRGSLLPGLLGVFLCTIAINMNSAVNMRLGLYGNGVWFLINAIVMTASLYLLCAALSRYDCCIIREAAYIGQNSIVYLGFNQLILAFLRRTRIGNRYPGGLFSVVSLALCLAVLHGIAKLLAKGSAKKLIGK